MLPGLGDDGNDNIELELDCRLLVFGEADPGGGGGGGGLPDFVRGKSSEFCREVGDVDAGMSIFETSTVLPDKLEGSPPEDPALRFDAELALRCSHRPLTPSTALKNPVDPAVSVLEIASRVGASCCSSLSSWIPSDNLRLISATTEGRSLQGCLDKIKQSAFAVGSHGVIFTLVRQYRTASDPLHVPKLHTHWSS